MPGLSTILISFRALKKKGLQWDTVKNILFELHTGREVCKLIEKHGQFLMEYNPLEAYAADINIARRRTVKLNGVRIDPEVRPSQNRKISAREPHSVASASIWHQ